MAVIIPVLFIEIERLKFSGFVAAVKCRVVILSNLTVTRRKRWHKASKIHNTAENREKVSKQSKLCDKLINRDYNAFINNHICSKLENGDSKPLFKFIANRR